PYPKESCPIHTVLADHNTRRGQDEVFWRQDGTSFFVQYVCAPVMKTGKCVGVVVIFEDITERKYAYEAMRQSEAQLRLITDAVPALIAYVDTNQCFRFNNKAFEQWFGLAREQVYGRHLKEVLGELAYQAIHEHVEQALTGHRVNYEAPIPYQQGGTRDINASYIPDIDGQGEVKGYVALIHDITAHKQAEQRLAYLAHYDTLTGLPNRTLLNDRLSQAMARRSAAHQTQVAILFLDLDHFKTINDTAGHSIADALLREVGERLSACVRIGDTVARLGGDEFAIILIDLIHKIDVGQFVQKIPDCLSAPFKIDGHEIFVTASIGVSLYPDDGLNAETLLKNADTAMYLAKQRGRNCYQYYSAALSAKAATRVSLENSLRQALARDEFVLHYQPQVDLATSRITAVEALVRWNNPRAGLVLPAQFIPLTEDTGLIVALGEWVLHTACAQNKAWQLAGLPPIRIGVNLSARQFQQQNKRTIVNHILHILQETGLDPHYLELELTESVLQTIEVAGMLRTLRGTGIQIAIDDFGTGYSSLSYLKRFPLDKLKIDKSFMQGVPDDPDNVAITTAIIAMAHSLKLKVIAEGVETLAQLDFLRSLKCDEIQGFLFSCALPAPELQELLAAQSDTL
ncbi:MAG: EAL domain-containing protein, partial [Gammaproteobacteria bacterium]